MVELLLNKGASVHLKNNDAQTPLAIAELEKKKGQHIRDSLRKRGAIDKTGKTLLHLAIERTTLAGRGDLIQNFVKTCPSLINVQDNEQKTALDKAFDKASDNEDSSIIEFLATLASRSSTVIRTATGKTALHMAILKKKQPLMERLLETIPNLIDEQDNEGKTALDLAMDTGNLDAIKLLSKHGAKTAKGHIALHQAVLNGNILIVKELLKDNPDLINARSPTGHTALHFAVQQKNAEMVRLFVTPRPTLSLFSDALQTTADVNAQDPAKTTPLELAIAQGSEEIVNILCTHGAIVRQKDLEKANETPQIFNILRKRFEQQPK